MCMCVFLGIGIIFVLLWFVFKLIIINIFEWFVFFGFLFMFIISILNE